MLLGFHGGSEGFLKEYHVFSGLTRIKFIAPPAAPVFSFQRRHLELLENTGPSRSTQLLCGLGPSCPFLNFSKDWSGCSVRRVHGSVPGSV